MPSDQVLRLPALPTVEQPPPPSYKDTSGYAEQTPYINAERPKVRKPSKKKSRSDRAKGMRRGSGGRFLANGRVGMAMTSSFTGEEELEAYNRIEKRIRGLSTAPDSADHRKGSGCRIQRFNPTRFESKNFAIRPDPTRSVYLQTISRTTEV
jgi:hypothetical protein